MKFCTVVNCMDGRVQLPVIEYLKKRFDAEYVDSITEPGPVKILAEEGETPLIESILSRVSVSVEKHGSRAVAVVGHYDCAGNPEPKERQLVQIEKSVEVLRKSHPQPEIVGLWVDEEWRVHEVLSDGGEG